MSSSTVIFQIPEVTAISLVRCFFSRLSIPVPINWNLQAGACGRHPVHRWVLFGLSCLKTLRMSSTCENWGISLQYLEFWPLWKTQKIWSHRASFGPAGILWMVVALTAAWQRPPPSLNHQATCFLVHSLF